MNQTWLANYNEIKNVTCSTRSDCKMLSAACTPPSWLQINRLWSHHVLHYTPKHLQNDNCCPAGTPRSRWIIGLHLYEAELMKVPWASGTSLEHWINYPSCLVGNDSPLHCSIGLCVSRFYNEGTLDTFPTTDRTKIGWCHFLTWYSSTSPDSRTNCTTVRRANEIFRTRNPTTSTASWPEDNAQLIT